MIKEFPHNVYQIDYCVVLFYFSKCEPLCLSTLRGMDMRSAMIGLKSAPKCHQRSSSRKFLQNNVVQLFPQSMVNK